MPASSAEIAGVEALIVDIQRRRHKLFPELGMILGDAMKAEAAVIAERDCAPRAMLSLREAAVIAEVSEGKVRKDIETGILDVPVVTRMADNRICTPWTSVFTFAAVYGNAHLSGELRRVAITKLKDDQWARKCHFRFEAPPAWKQAGLSVRWISNELKGADKSAWKTLYVDTYLKLDMEKIYKVIEPRILLYVVGLLKVEEKPGVLGGEAVFKGSRVSVTHIGKMLEDGETMENILADFPNLTESDVHFSKLYHLAHPSVGRPRNCAERGNGVLSTAT